jgi:hypothetical protein
MFGGASDVQKAGKFLQIDYPHLSCIHGTEHLASLAIKDNIQTLQGQILLAMYKQWHKWLDESMHRLQVVMPKKTQLPPTTSVAKACDCPLLVICKWEVTWRTS